MAMQRQGGLSNSDDYKRSLLVFLSWLKRNKEIRFGQVEGRSIENNSCQCERDSSFWLVVVVADTPPSPTGASATRLF